MERISLGNSSMIASQTMFVQTHPGEKLSKQVQHYLYCTLS